jgi:DNA-directed RNA polymerase sigma subunit (sigma70/sigma32)
VLIRPKVEIADQARTIRIPVHMIETINKIVRTSRQMLNEIGREPTPEELAEKLGMPLPNARHFTDFLEQHVNSMDKVKLVESPSIPLGIDEGAI